MQSFSVRAPFIHTSLKAFYAEKTEANPPGQASAIRNIKIKILLKSLLKYNEKIYL